MCSHENQRGQVLPLVALCLVVLLGFGGMAVDVGYLQYQQRQQQSAADAAALGGAEWELKNSSDCTTTSTALSAAAKSDSALNGYTDQAAANGGTVAVTVNHPASSGPFASDPCSVQVQVYSPHPTFLA